MGSCWCAEDMVATHEIEHWSSFFQHFLPAVLGPMHVGLDGAGACAKAMQE